jgi:predicted RNase H-like HicB family nuclease
MIRYILPIEIQPLEEGGYLASCPIIQGCHAEGKTITEAMDNVEDVARILLELRIEDGLPLPEELHQAEPDAALHGELLLTVGTP